MPLCATAYGRGLRFRLSLETFWGAPIHEEASPQVGRRIVESINSGLIWLTSHWRARLNVHTMTNQPIARDERTQPRSRLDSKRARAASVLLFGWLLFWVVGIVQPCCATLASSHDDGHATSQSVASENTEDSEAAHTHSHEDDQCPQVLTADTAFLLPAKADHSPYPIVISYVVPFLTVSKSSNPFDLYHPSPPPRIYLRTQRLLI